MKIALYHSHYSPSHLGAVTEQMITLGPPSIRCIYNPVHDIWMAIEGCHRLRAAEVLGLTPVIIDISDDEMIAEHDLGTLHGSDGQIIVTPREPINTAMLLQVLIDGCHHSTIISYD